MLYQYTKRLLNLELQHYYHIQTINFTSSRELQYLKEISLPTLSFLNANSRLHLVPSTACADSKIVPPQTFWSCLANP